MLLTIPQVLDQDHLVQVRKILGEATFVAGRLSAGKAAQRVKHNLEADPHSAEVDTLNRIVVGQLYQHPVFRSAALPYRVSGAFFARYTQGMHYGNHVDDAVMGEGNRYRSDISITLFLTGPESYEGGELIIHTSAGENKIKLPAGDAVIYPSYSLHRIAEVTSGERLVAVAWAQSLVRDPLKRQVLYDLDLVRQTLRNVTPEAEITARADVAYMNLMRLWAEV
jgi:PKHD-type hydroxylase